MREYRVQLRRLGAAPFGLPRRASGRAPSPRRVGIRSRLPDTSGGPAARIGQHPESGALRDSVRVSRGARRRRGGALAHSESQTRSSSASRPEPARDRRVVGEHARDASADGGVDLRRRLENLRMLRAPREGHRFQSKTRRPMRVVSWRGSGCFPVTRCPPILGPVSSVVTTTPTSSRNCAVRREALLTSSALARAEQHLFAAHEVSSGFACSCAVFVSFQSWIFVSAVTTTHPPHAVLRRCRSGADRSSPPGTARLPTGWPGGTSW